jgi:NAD+ kinase
MATFAFVPHRARREAAVLAAEAIEWLTGEGHEVRVPDPDAQATGLTAWSYPEETLTDGLDVAVSLGGDGTMLRAVDLVSGAGVPVLGVNVGHLGYLTEVDPPGLRSALERFLAGDYSVETRMTLSVTITPPEAPPTYTSALNEAVLQRASNGHTVRIAVIISGTPFLTYAADALIVATPTGSTAYNLSARGPVVEPDLRAIIVTPVAAHMLFDRAMVLGPDRPIDLEILDAQAADLVIDGHPLVRLQPGAHVSCQAGKHDAQLVTFGERDFHRILKSKFGLTDR